MTVFACKETCGSYNYCVENNVGYFTKRCLERPEMKRWFDMFEMQSPKKHAPEKVRGTDEGKKGQARANKKGDELPES